MPRKKKQPNLQPGDNSPLEGTTVNVGSLDHLVGQVVGIEPAPLGNMSEADRLAIMGASIDTGMTASEMLAGPLNATVDAAVADLKLPAPPEEIAMGARVATLEQRLTDLEKAMEAFAVHLRSGAVGAPASRFGESAPAFVIPATPEEEAVYSETNWALTQQGKPAHNGLQAWRDAGRPALKARPETRQGRAA